MSFFFLPGGQHGNVQPFSDEDASIETLSHCSSFSDATSVADEGTRVFAHLVMHILQPLFELVNTHVGYAVSGCVCMGQCLQFVFTFHQTEMSKMV